MLRRRSRERAVDFAVGFEVWESRGCNCVDRVVRRMDRVLHSDVRARWRVERCARVVSRWVIG